MQALQASRTQPDKALWGYVLFVALLGCLVLKTPLRTTLLTRISYAIAYFVTFASLVMFVLIVRAFGQIKAHHIMRSTRDARTAMAKRKVMVAGREARQWNKGGSASTGTSLTNPMFGDDGPNDDFAQARLGWEEEIEELKDMMDELNGSDHDAAKDKLVLQKRIVAKRGAAVAADRATMRGSVRNLGTD